jgi:hypothetical protein
MQPENKKEKIGTALRKWKEATQWVVKPNHARPLKIKANWIKARKPKKKNARGKCKSRQSARIYG